MSGSKWFSGLLALLMVTVPALPGMADSEEPVYGSKPVSQIQQELQAAGITDVKADAWYAGSVTVLVQAGLLAPTGDGQIHPEAVLNATDGVAIFAKVLGIAAKADTPEVALAKAQEAGLLAPGQATDHALTRLELAVMLGKALGIEPKAITDPADYPFADFEAAAPEERGVLKALYAMGIFTGYLEEGVRTFRPGNTLTLAEFAALVDRVLGAQ